MPWRCGLLQLRPRPVHFRLRFKSRWHSWTPISVSKLMTLRTAFTPLACDSRNTRRRSRSKCYNLPSGQALEASLVKTMRAEDQAIHGALATLQEVFQENLGRKKAKESNEWWGRVNYNSLIHACGFFPTFFVLVVARFATSWPTSTTRSVCEEKALAVPVFVVILYVFARCPQSINPGMDLRLLRIVIDDWKPQIIILYGLAQSNAGAQEFNDELLALAAQRVQQVNVPAIIMGDFNADVSKHWPVEGFCTCNSYMRTCMVSLCHLLVKRLRTRIRRFFLLSFCHDCNPFR